MPDIETILWRFLQTSNVADEFINNFIKIQPYTLLSAYIESICQNNDTTNIHLLIERLFNWHNTYEGYEFWKKVSDLWKDYIQLELNRSKPIIINGSYNDGPLSDEEVIDQARDALRYKDNYSKVCKSDVCHIAYNGDNIYRVTFYSRLDKSETVIFEIRQKQKQKQNKYKSIW